ncbi:MAG: DNA polymerase I [Eubacterium sp.]|nr:DNA polymerase I [Eubacterium sp.]
MPEREKILLIDGHSILNRAFYGLPLLTNSEGLHTNAVYGFLNMLFKVIREENPKYLAVAFDLSAPTFRHKKFPEYKGTRHPMPDELREQVPVMKEVLKALGITILTREGYEADDILGTIAKRSQEQGLDAVIFSGDRDLLQLADKHIRILLPKTVKGQTTIQNFTPEEVEKVYGITPRQVIEIKSLMGDSSDNIPGLPGVGEKTAQKILQEFGNLENAREHLEEIKPKRAMEAMRDHYDLAVLSKELATIDTNVPIELKEEDAVLRDIHTEEAFRMFKKLDFKNLLSEFDRKDQPRKEERAFHVAVLREKKEADAFEKEIFASNELGIFLLGDYDRVKAVRRVIGLAVSLSEERTVYLPAAAVNAVGTQMSLFGDEQQDPQDGFAVSYLLDLTGRILNSDIRVSTFGLKKMLDLAEAEERKELYDMEIGSYLLDPLPSDYPYDLTARKYAGRELRSAEEIFQNRKLPDLSAMENEKAAEYAGNCAFSALLVLHPVLDELGKDGMRGLYEDLEMPLAFTLHHMEEEGMELKSDVLKNISRKLALGIAEKEKTIYKLAGHEFNINSPKQLGTVLFEEMKLPGGKKTKTGYSTAADVLEKLAEYEPVVRDILDYRQLTKLKSTYADSLDTYAAADGRIHSLFNQTITATGRISSSEPNLQNIPVRMELGREIRKAFVPKQGCVYLDADYSQIELRMLAHMSGDEQLIEAYREEKDIHAITASQVFHVPFEQVTPLQRRNAKAVNFGIIYGISSFGLSQDLSISQKEAQEYIKKYFETYPKIKAFLDGLVESAKEKGYSETIFGRRRPVPELKEKNFMRRQFGERVAMNAPIQGSAADVIKIAMVNVDRRLRKEGWKSRLVLQVHDELILEVPKEELEPVSKLLKEEMTGAASLKVALEVEMNTGTDWYEAK